MNQENSTTENSKEMRKRILLGVLAAVLLGVFYFQFFGSNRPAPARPIALNKAVGTPTPTPRAGDKKVPTISEPLELNSMNSRTGSGEGTGRNIFIYPTPTPPPTPKPVAPTPTPPPPPVTLISANPGSVYARSPDFYLSVIGEKIPADGQIYLNGRAVPTAYVSARELKATVTSDAIRSAGSVSILVRSKSDAKLFSNQLPLNVNEAPKPPYSYVGRIEKRTGVIAVLKTKDDDQVINAGKDQVVGRWKVISITPQRITLEDTTIKVTHTIEFTGENGQT
ncbi:MAG: hypothetical protein J2P41_19425 [Blastocatellia bacterium]|nr:hypothetical protein [Blastocatellia bacterium]